MTIQFGFQGHECLANVSLSADKALALDRPVPKVEEVAEFMAIVNQRRVCGTRLEISIFPAVRSAVVTSAPARLNTGSSLISAMSRALEICLIGTLPVSVPFELS